MKLLTSRTLLLGIFATLFSTLSYSQTARLQVIHNAADPAAATVDVYLTSGGTSTLLLDNFEFRTATPFIDAPAGSPIQVGIAPASSTSVTDTIANFNYTLTSGETYIITANGVLNPMMFEANPDAVPTAFNLWVTTPARETAAATGVDLFVIHGATDAPTVDVRVKGAGLTLVNDAPYGGITPYFNVPAGTYVLEVTDAAQTTVVTTAYADLSALSGSAAVVFASGFLSPANDMNGEAFGVFAALPNGNVIQLPLATARLQVIHNAADPGAASVDVYLTDGGTSNLLLDNFAFRDATPYIDAPAGSPIQVGIAPGNSTSVNDTIANFNFNLGVGETYALVANGVLDPMMFEANPDMQSTAFNLWVVANAQEAAALTGVDFAVVHGATDAPTVDVRVNGTTTTLVDNAAYNDITAYLNVPAASYNLDVTTADQSVTVATYTADLSTLDGGAAIVFASGFLSPANDQNGAAFGLFAALANGDVIELPLLTSTNGAAAELEGTVFPNPADQELELLIPAAQSGQMVLTDLSGHILMQRNLNGSAIKVDVSTLPAGMYSLMVATESGNFNTKVTIGR